MRLRKRAYLLIGVILVVILGFIGFKVLHKPVIVFAKSEVQVEVNGKLDENSYIKEMRCDKSDLKIDASKVNTKKLGKYEIDYTVKDKVYKLPVEVVDTKAPEIKTQELDIDLGMEVKAEDFITEIKDQTKTKCYFEKNYKFDKAGKQNITVVVEDEGGNKAKKETTINIVEDKEKPTIEGLSDLTVKVGNKTNYLSGLTIKDNRDKDPKVDIDSSQVDLNKIGEYTVKYTVTDRSNNIGEYTRTVKVVKNVTPKKIGMSDEKIVYLTFDDGPSANTGKILDILDKYNAKATFFVTGNGKKYNKYIKEAHDRGHTIGLHTYSHDYKKVYSSVNAYFDDLNKVGQMVKDEIGYVPHYIRFPGGSSNTTSKKYSKGIMTTLVMEVQNRGYQYYDWNGDTTDAARNNQPVSILVKNGTSSHAKNINILAHDTQAKSTTVDALPKIIEYYQSKGYQFKAIDDTSFTPHHHVNN